MSSDGVCTNCDATALVVDDVSMNLACSHCGHVVPNNEFATVGDFWEGRPAGQQQLDEGDLGTIDTARKLMKMVALHSASGCTRSNLLTRFAFLGSAKKGKTVLC